MLIHLKKNSNLFWALTAYTPSYCTSMLPILPLVVKERRANPSISPLFFSSKKVLTVSFFISAKMAQQNQ